MESRELDRVVGSANRSTRMFGQFSDGFRSAFFEKALDREMTDQSSTKTSTETVKLDLPFRRQHKFEARAEEARRMLLKYTDRIPIIVERTSAKIPLIDKRKFLVPRTLTAGEFSYVIRKRIKLAPDEAIFIFFGRNLTPTSAPMADVYEKHKDRDGFLYAEYSSESTYGAFCKSPATMV
jgi:GABA(A) receptor-associated protein